MDLISVVIVNWNGRKWLSKCLSSLLAQTYQSLEIILVDNGSTDGSLSMIASNFPQVKIVAQKKNYGFAAGNAAGIKKARGSLILLLNNDTWVDTSFVSQMHQFFKSHSYDVIGPREVGYGEAEDVAAHRLTIDVLGHPVQAYEHVYKSHFYLLGMCMLFRKQLYMETGGFDTTFFMYCEDVDWCWRLHLLGKRLYYVPEIVVHHINATALPRYSSRVFYLRNYNTLRMLLKNYSLLSLIWVLPLYVLQNIFEMLGLLFLLRPHLIGTYLHAYYGVIGSLPSLLSDRRMVQSNRIVPDRELFALMYHGVGKLRHFFVKNPPSNIQAHHAHSR